MSNVFPVSSDQIIGKVVRVTPEMAAAWLETSNYNNRKLRPQHVRKLQRAMERGEWRLTHQGIAFNARNQLIDGQHRLAAIVAAKMPQYLMVFQYTTIDDSPMAVPLDETAKRSVADASGIEKKAAEVAGILCVLETGQHPTNSEGFLYYSAFQVQIDKLHSVCPSTAKKRSAAPVRAAAVVLMAMHEAESDEIADQYRRLVNLDLDGMWSSVSALVRSLENHFTNGGTGRVEQFVRGFIGLRPNNRNLRVIRIGNSGEVVSIAKRFIGSVIEEFRASGRCSQ